MNILKSPPKTNHWHLRLVLLLLLSGINLLLAQSEKTPYQYVNPFIGTQQMGHCYPGATVPFGMVQLSPDTESPAFFKNGKYNPAVYRYCSGYQFDDNTILGFSHTHFSGTGHSDLGDFLLVPTVGDLKLNPGTAAEPDRGYRSRFSHDTETARPGYYKVTLSDYNILVELTASTRVGMHRYTFPSTQQAHVILDMVHGIYNYEGKVIWAYLRKESDTLITGFRQTLGWGKTRYIYFALEFSQPFKSYGLINEKKPEYGGFWSRHWAMDRNFPERAGKSLKAYFNFTTSKDKPLLIKLALSGVSTRGALNNLRKEISHWDFDRVRSNAQSTWENELNKILISAPEKEKEIFYTSLYHTLIGTVIYMDVDGAYRGLDQNIHQAGDFINYASFSLWDTYRALHPLYVLLQPARNQDMIKSMLAHYRQSVHHMLPVWSFQANENWCMIGYHAVPVIVDAYVKGLRGFDVQEAFNAVVSTAGNTQYSGLDSYLKLGYVSFDGRGGSTGASKTLEYAYDDWTIARFAGLLNHNSIAREFFRRARNYQNLFDKRVKFIRPRLKNGEWKQNFDTLNTHGQGFIEGNAWNYSLYVPHDIWGYVKLYGGKKPFVQMLDKLFTMQLPASSYAGSEDVEKSGIIGNYVHGNEPSHHIPYLYNWAGAPWKTQEKIRTIADTFYTTRRDGICGNDDCGQMSAWYIFSALGFYPVCPGTDQYVFGTPLIDRCDLKLENGKTFSIEARNRSAKNFYIQNIRLNGRLLTRPYILHREITGGGKLVYYMGSRPNKNWGRTIRPYSLSR